tara:strand:+ start:267 stop:467 length:201 start_codon:yes stop_codon:yes gene_type:complete
MITSKTPHKLKINLWQAEWIVEECKNSLDFGDWFYGDNFTSNDVEKVELIANLMKQAQLVTEEDKT